MKIFVQDAGGKEYPLEIDDGVEVREVMGEIYRLTGICTSHQRLRCNGGRLHRGDVLDVRNFADLLAKQIKIVFLLSSTCEDDCTKGFPCKFDEVDQGKRIDDLEKKVSELGKELAKLKANEGKKKQQQQFQQQQVQQQQYQQVPMAAPVAAPMAVPVAVQQVVATGGGGGGQQKQKQRKQHQQQQQQQQQQQKPGVAYYNIKLS